MARLWNFITSHYDALLLAIALIGLSVGTALYFSGTSGSDLAWALGTLPLLAGLLVQIARSAGAMQASILLQHSPCRRHLPLANRSRAMWSP